MTGSAAIDDGVVRAHLRSWRARSWAVGLGLISLGLAFVPLFDVLGFEAAFALALVASVASLDLAAALTRRTIRQRRAAAATTTASGSGQAAVAAGAGHAVVRLAGRAIATNLLLLIAPLAILALNGLRVRNCDWWFGITTYLLMPGLSVVIAATAGTALGLLAGPRRWLGNALPYVFVVGSIAVALWRFYAAPPVFSYSWLVGYFPGNLYDEDIALGAPFYWARLEQMAWALTALAAAAVLINGRTLALNGRGLRRFDGLRRRWRPIAGLAAALVASIWLATTAGRHGYALDADDVAAELDGVYRTEHFVIRYAPRPDIVRDIARIGEEHEFRLAQVVRALGVAPSGMITSFYFADAEQKARLMGAKNVYMAKPWRKEIYVHHDDFPHRVLRHEIAHVVAGAFGDPIFHVSAGTILGIPLRFNVGLIEGLAVAADWPDHYDRALTPHQAVKAMQMLGYAPPVDALLSTEFLTVSSARGYTVAGSFVRFLLERHGVEALQALYRSGGDFAAAYGQSQRALIAEWREMIEAVELPAEAAEVVRERFRRAGIFSRPCPHAIAAARARAGELAAAGRVDAAVLLARRVCSLAPDEPQHQLSLADLLTAGARLQGDRERREGALAEADAIYQGFAADALQSSAVRADAIGSLVEAAALAGDWVTTARWLDVAVTLPVEDDTLRTFEGQRFAVTHDGPAAAALRGYFWHGPQRDPVLAAVHAAEAVAAEPTFGLAHYLLGRNLRQRDDAAAVASLTQALALGLPTPRFVRAAARMLAESGYAIGDDEAVERAAAVLTAPEEPEVDRLYGIDWRERVRWRRTGKL